MKKTAIVIFLALPLLLLAVILCSPDRALSEAENRPLRTKADIRWNVMDGGFQDWLEDYLSDQFPFRDALKRAEVRCAIAAGKRDIGGAYIGEGMRLFQKITPADVNQASCLRYARRIRRLASETGLPTVVIYVPSAGVALREELPKGAPMYDYDALWDSLRQELTADGFRGITLIDIRKRMAANADHYYQSDHHWTASGTETVYQAWCQTHEWQPRDIEWVSASDTFHGTLYSKVPDSRVPYDTIRLPVLDPAPQVVADGQDIPFYDLAALTVKDQYNVFQGGNHGITVITNPALPEQDGLTLLMLKDSFANSLVPLLVPHYRQIVLLDERYAFVDASQIAQTYHADEIAVVREIISTP